MSSKGRLAGTAALGLCALQAAALAWCAAHDSPTWDEVGHLAAGASNWQFSNFDLYNVNPPLVRLIAALPVVAAGPEMDWTLFSLRPGRRPEFDLGQAFIELHGESAPSYFMVARWACIPIVVVGGLVCFAWARELFGDAAGVAAILLWVFDPAILAHGHLMTPDASAAALGLTAQYLFWRWLRAPNWQQALLAGLGLAAALLTKFTWVLFLPLWPVLYIVWVRGASLPGREGRTQAAQLAAVPLVAFAVVNAAYGFEGTFAPLGRYEFISRTLAGGAATTAQTVPTVGNRFAGGPIGLIPVPLPRNYLLGIDRQKWDFERKFWTYCGGNWSHGGPWYFYLYALGVKTPTGTLVLVGLAAFVATLRPQYRSSFRNELVLLSPAIAVLGVATANSGVCYLRYVLPAFPFALIAVSRVFRSYALGHRWVLGISLISASVVVLGSLAVFPHSLSFFNQLAGGPRRGHEHLLNSDIDWGQDLGYLRAWLRRHPEATTLRFAYENSVSASALGLKSALPPVGLTEGEGQQDSVGPIPGWYALSVNRIRSRTKEYEYFLRFEPVAMAGYSIYIYHLTPDQVNPVRRELGLPEAPEVATGPSQ